MDIFEKCFSFSDVKEAKETGIYPYFIPLDENEGTEVTFNDRRVIMCGSNNYLGLTTHPKVRQAAIDAIERYGTSCTGSRFLNGNMSLHENLEAELAEWVGKEAALVFSTGMQVNLGTISAIVGRGDYVILDKEDHASIVDGARLSASATMMLSTWNGSWRACRRTGASCWWWMASSAWRAILPLCRRSSRFARNMASA